VQSSLQVPEPDWLHEQSFVHPVRMHAPLFEHFIVHPFPVHERLAVAEDSDCTVQPPAGHEKVQPPLPWHTNWQPEDGQAREHGSEVTQKHSCPGVQLVELVFCVVATHATSTDRVATKPARRIVPPDTQHYAGRGGRAHL
jgi:hypothetical protein